MASKRKEFNSISDATPQTTNIIGIVTAVSPMKKGKRANFFEAKMTDGDKNMRIVGFHTDQQNQMTRFYESKSSVAIANCELKNSKFSNDLEALLKTSSTIECSPKKIKLSSTHDDAKQDAICCLADLQTMPDYERGHLEREGAQRRRAGSCAGRPQKTRRHHSRQF